MNLLGRRTRSNDRKQVGVVDGHLGFGHKSVAIGSPDINNDCSHQRPGGRGLKGAPNHAELDEHMRICASGAAALAGLLIWASTIEAQEPTIQRGRAFAEANCARCHAIGRSGESPLRKAPPFQTLHERYPVEDLEEALAEGIRTGHPAMPEFALDENQIRDLISYLKSLER
jgi:cytochrome c